MHFNVSNIIADALLLLCRHLLLQILRSLLAQSSQRASLCEPLPERTATTVNGNALEVERRIRLLYSGIVLDMDRPTASLLGKQFPRKYNFGIQARKSGVLTPKSPLPCSVLTHIHH